jgi:uncharacterized protein (UPF0297 family)
MSHPKEKKVFIKYLTALEFELVRKTKHSELWKHFAKSISFQLSGTPSNIAWLHDAKRQFQKLISSNFDKDELKELLKPFFKKHKVRFNKQGQLRLLRVEGDLETEMLRDLLIEEIPVSNEDDFEFSDELKTKIKKVIAKPKNEN